MSRIEGIEEGKEGGGGGEKDVGWGTKRGRKKQSRKSLNHM